MKLSSIPGRSGSGIKFPRARQIIQGAKLLGAKRKLQRKKLFGVCSKSQVTKPLGKLKTGVPGLDDLLMGGLSLPPSKTGLIMLIKGRPGSGKTTLALQIAISAAGEWGKSLSKGESQCYYCTCEQEKDDINDKIIHLSGNKKHLIKINPWENTGDGNSYENEYSQVTSTLQTINDITRELNKRNDGKEKKLRIMVVDGLNLLNDKEQDIVDIERLITAMRKACRVGIIVFEPRDRAYGNVDFQSDVVIELRSTETEDTENYYLTHLSIAKARFQTSALGWHQYKIRNHRMIKASDGNEKVIKHGIEVFPSIHFRLNQHRTLHYRLDESRKPIAEDSPKKDRLGIDDGSFLDQILRCGTKDINLMEGSCTVLLGPRRSWKTQLTFNFLKVGSERKRQSGLLVSLIDNQGRIANSDECLCNKECSRDYKHKDCLKNVYLLQIPPGCITASEFFDALEERLAAEEERDAEAWKRWKKSRTNDEPPKEKRIRRLVFWDLAQLEYRFPLLYNDPMFLPGLMSYLKYSKIKHRGELNDKERNRGIDGRRHITSLFMGASSSDIAKSASAMADNVLFCWQDELSKISTPNEPEEKNGVAFYVDRVEGKPGKNKLFFINNKPEVLKEPETMETQCLTHAEGMIAAIQQLQGLAGLSKYIQSNGTTNNGANNSMLEL